MSLSINSTAGLRFGALVRVSTEKQEKKGESLATQRASNARDVNQLGGTIAGWYGGQEHGTPQWEKREVDRLIRDAARGLFDAVLVAYADRWSRDNAKSKEGLEAFRRHGVRFFIGTMEMNLFDPGHRFMLGMHAEVGEFQALQTAKKSIENKIARARRGIPTCGRLPYGRTWNGKAWGLDPKKQALILEAARRYLGGEGLVKLAQELGIAHSRLHVVLMKDAGEEWSQTFTSKALGIHEVIPTPVPALLPAKIIHQLHEQAQANKTFKHGSIRHKYLLSRMVFCACCGRSFSGHTDAFGRRYYWHPRKPLAHRPCSDGKAIVFARDLEKAVLADLFDLFGNAAAVQRAIAAAAPDGDEQEDLRAQQGRLLGQLEEVQAGTDRVVRAIAGGTLGEAEAARELGRLRERQASLKGTLGELESRLAQAPDPLEAKRLAEEMLARRQAARSPDKMTWEDQRALCQLVFAGRSDGRGHLSLPGERNGVYIRRVEGQKRGTRQQWHFRLAGRVCVDFWSSTGARLDDLFPSPQAAMRDVRQAELLRQSNPKSATLGEPG
jgi:DNA invertase Pin-like site-specific DNA recombinase